MDINQELLAADESLLMSWADGQASPQAGPWLATISVTNKCNHRCGMCPHSRVMRPDQGFMDLDLFAKVVKWLPASITKVYLMKQGEPFLNPELGDMVALLRQERPDVHIAMHTNGTLASKQRLERILPLVDSLGFSFSGISPKVHSLVHGARTFSAVYRNLQDAGALMLEMDPDRRPHLFVDYVDQQANCGESREQVLSYFADNFPGVSSVDIHWVFNWQGEIDEGNLGIYERLPEKDFPCCVLPWATITVCHDGKISYCSEEPRENQFLGDVTQGSFEEIWQGEAFARFRELMAQRRFGELAEMGYHCHVCSYLWSMHTQSPRNLCNGYQPKEHQRSQTAGFSGLLENSGSHGLAQAFELFRQGEITQAMACLLFLQSTASEPAVLEACQRLLGNCQKVLSQYRNLGLWQKEMGRENQAPDQGQASYNSLEQAVS